MAEPESPERPQASVPGASTETPKPTNNEKPSTFDAVKTAILDNPTNPLSSVLRLFEGETARKERQQRMYTPQGQVAKPEVESARSYFADPQTPASTGGAPGQGEAKSTLPTVSADDLRAAPEWITATPEERHRAVNKWAKERMGRQIGAPVGGRVGGKASQ